MRKTKIVCTIGPASNNEEMLRKMMLNGMNVARLNFSHGTHEDHKKTIEKVRRVRDELKLPVAVLLDTKGPEIRLKDFAKGKVTLVDGQKFTFTSEEVDGDETRVSTTYRELSKQLKAGNTILVNDGQLEFLVEATTETDVICRVIRGGVVSNHKGVNIPNVHLDFTYISEQDEADLRFGVEHKVDFVAASFVRCKEDVIAVRNFLDYYGGNDIRIISKIENNEGVQNFDEILAYSDGIMVARGDMGVEIEYEKLPGIQKNFIKKCYEAGKMVITATQMLESMIHNATPTRAEITDVANAVFDGTSAIMLSGETAVGDHPELVIEAMAKIAEQAEHDAFEMDIYRKMRYTNDINDTTNAICDAACTTAKDVGAKAIVAVTMHGNTARRMSKFRPQQPIIAATPCEKTYHQLALSWGVYPVMALYQADAGKLFDHAVACAKRFGYVQEQDRLVIAAGANGVTNVLKVQTVGEEHR